MTTRLLPREEWPRLAGTEAETIWPQLTDAARVVVVEDATGIVGCVLLQPVLHAECLWIAPAHRGRGGVARRLWDALRVTAREGFGVPWVMSGCASKQMAGLLAHLGAERILADHYMVPMGDA